MTIITNHLVAEAGLRRYVILIFLVIRTWASALNVAKRLIHDLGPVPRIELLRHGCRVNNITEEDGDNATFAIATAAARSSATGWVSLDGDRSMICEE